MSVVVGTIRRKRACSAFVEPRRGPRKFCTTCGFTRLLHKPREEAIVGEFRIGAAMWRLQWVHFWAELGRAVTIGGGRR